jgi:hypothetical protein
VLEAAGSNKVAARLSAPSEPKAAPLPWDRFVSEYAPNPADAVAAHDVGLVLFIPRKPE